MRGLSSTIRSLISRAMYLTVEIVRQYDINNDKLPCRLDVLYGYKTLRPQLACRIATLA